MKDKMLIALSVLLSFLFVLNIASALENKIDPQEVASIDNVATL